MSLIQNDRRKYIYSDATIKIKFKYEIRKILKIKEVKKKQH